MPKLTVHNIPFLLKPFFELGSYIAATVVYIQLWVFIRISQIKFVNEEYLDEYPSHILCVWHEDLTLFFMAHRKLKRPHIWMTYPIWYMRPIHILKKWTGVQELAYGASGIDGKKALNQVLARLEDGWCTFIAPDGPKGPVKIVKDGVLHMSLQTQTPVIPISFSLDKEKRSSSWDKKKYPGFGANLVVKYGEPVFVSEENYEEARKEVGEKMS